MLTKHSHGSWALCLGSLMVFCIFFLSCDKDSPTEANLEPEPEPNTVTDVDGNVYPTVQIGDQVWMAENLWVMHYRNYDPIPEVARDQTWGGLGSGAYCNYDGYQENAKKYGRLYNWYAAVDPRGLAPEGWHVPTDEEWKQLELYLGMSVAQADTYLVRGTNEGDKLKSTKSWTGDNKGTDECGFCAVPGGYRQANCQDLGVSACFWTSTVAKEIATYAYFRALMADESGIYRRLNIKWMGFSVRCVKDD